MKVTKETKLTLELNGEEIRSLRRMCELTLRTLDGETAGYAFAEELKAWIY